MSTAPSRSHEQALAPAETECLPDAVLQALRSHAFEKTPALRSLLLFLWRQRNDPVSEYAIATEALGRSPEFDARTDATVRVQISRLRQRLERYYETEGVHLEERLAIPLGSHQVQIERKQPPARIESSLAVSWSRARPERLNPKRMNRPWIVACAVLAVISLVLAIALIRKSPSTAPQGKPIVASGFWKRFFGNGRTTRIILPTPVFFSFRTTRLDPNGNVMFRDTDVNDFAGGDRSAPLNSLEKTLGHPELAQNYTVTSDTFASVELVRYLDRSGLDTTVLSAADAPLAALDRENVIALGTWGTLTPLKRYLDQMTFVLRWHERHVENRNPQPGEPRFVDMVSESSTRSIWPGVVGLLPGPNDQTHLLVLSSRHTRALVAFLTSSSGLDELDRAWKKKGRPEYYEALINSEMDGDRLVRFSLVALHPFQAQAQK